MLEYRDAKDFTLWQSYEDVAKHFNELLIRLRTQALGGLAGIVALSGFALNFTQKPATAEQWQVLFGTSLFFFIAWISLAILDLGYYDKLLSGAVIAIVEHERQTPSLPSSQTGENSDALSRWDEKTNLRGALAAQGLEKREINLSTIIAAMVPNHRQAIWAFYLLVGCILFIGVVATGIKASSVREMNRSALESKFDRVQGERVRFVVEPPTVAPATIGGDVPKALD